MSDLCDPLTSDLMWEFVSDDLCDPLSAGLGGDLFVVQHGRLSVGDQSPVLHSSQGVVRNSYHLYRI